MPLFHVTIAKTLEFEQYVEADSASEANSLACRVAGELEEYEAKAVNVSAHVAATITEDALPVGALVNYVAPDGELDCREIEGIEQDVRT